MIEKKEILSRIEILEAIIKFHTEYGVIESTREREEYIDDILDELSKLYEKLKELE